jgi:hypothetical protein
MSSKTSSLEERLSPGAAEFYKSLGRDSRDRVRELIEHIRQNPRVDGISVFPFKAEDISWHVLVAGDFTIFFRPEGDKVFVDSIERSPTGLKQAAQVV